HCELVHEVPHAAGWLSLCYNKRNTMLISRIWLTNISLLTAYSVTKEKEILMRPLLVAYSLIGSFFVVERLLRQGESARSIDEGPYRLVRHPGYLGSLLLWLGAGVATANGIVTAMIILPLVRAYHYRMRTEEALLTHAFPQAYPGYAQRTWRLIPFIY